MPLKSDKLITPEIIGTVNKPVEIGRFKRLIVEENISAAGFTTAVPDASPQVDHGLTLDPATHKLTFEDNVAGAVTFESAITMQSTLNVSGLITANGGITAGGHFTMGTWNISGAGGNVGLGFSGATAIFSDPVNINGLLTMGANIKLVAKYISYDGTNAGFYVDASNIAKTVGSMVVGNNLTTSGYVNCGDYIVSTNSITSGGYVKADSGAEFRHGVNSGVSTTIDFSTYAGTITISGGIITNVP